MVFGKPDTTALNLSEVAMGRGGFVIKGIDAFDRSGLSVSGAGDVNGDGLFDLIIGAKDADATGDASGESYVVFGKPDTKAVNLNDVVNGLGGFVINGVDAYDWSGISVDSAGDVNGDGLDDPIIGAFGVAPFDNY
ncbi:conserved hypothetical protein [Beggiatoa sp. SS]|nr:conserved hypothetical protein [Beggiatoa sp. SS]